MDYVFDYDLIKTRVIAFLYQALSMLILAVVASVMSPEFRDIVVQHAGDGVTGSIILMLFDAGVKHIRNVKVLTTYENNLGTSKASDRPLLV